MSAKKDVAVTENKPMFAAEVPDYIDRSSHLGSEDVGMEDVALPRLSIIQDLSPQHKKSKPEYIEGAEPGMVFNTVTGELYDGELYIVPCYYMKEFVVWKDVNKGGGFRGAFPTELEAKRAMMELEDASDCEVVDTAQHYVLVLKPRLDGSFETIEAVISMSKSQMKVNRQLNSQIRLAGGDRFSRVYSLSAVTDQNAASQEYYNWKVKPAGYAPKEVYEAGKSMYEAIKAGEKTVSREDAAATGADTDDHITGEDLDNM